VCGSASRCVWGGGGSAADRAAVHHVRAVCVFVWGYCLAAYADTQPDSADAQYLGSDHCQCDVFVDACIAAVGRAVRGGIACAARALAVCGRSDESNNQHRRAVRLCGGVSCAAVSAAQKRRIIRNIKIKDINQIIKGDIIRKSSGVKCETEGIVLAFIPSASCHKHICTAQTARWLRGLLR